MIDDNDIRRLDEIYVRKDDCHDIQNHENHSGVDGDIASHKSTAICWRYQKAKGITKKRAASLLVLPFFFIAISKVLLFRFALFGFPFQIWIFCFRLLQSAF